MNCFTQNLMCQYCPDVTVRRVSIVLMWLSARSVLSWFDCPRAQYCPDVTVRLVSVVLMWLSAGSVLSWCDCPRGQYCPDVTVRGVSIVLMWLSAGSVLSWCDCPRGQYCPDVTVRGVSIVLMWLSPGSVLLAGCNCWLVADPYFIITCLVSGIPRWVRYVPELLSRIEIRRATGLHVPETTV